MIEYDNGKVLLDFYANWCGKCKMLMPKVDEIAKNNPDLKVIKVNVDEQSDLVDKFSITNLPTFILLEDGEVKQIGGLDVLNKLEDK